MYPTKTGEKFVDFLKTCVNNWRDLPPEQVHTDLVNTLRSLREEERGFSTSVGIHMSRNDMRLLIGRRIPSRVMRENIRRVTEGTFQYGTGEKKPFNKDEFLKTLESLIIRCEGRRVSRSTNYDRNRLFYVAAERFLNECSDFDALRSYVAPPSKARATVRIDKELVNFIEFFRIQNGLSSMGLAATMFIDPARSKW